jgi:hypothetical protein
VPPALQAPTEQGETTVAPSAERGTLGEQQKSVDLGAQGAPAAVSPPPLLPSQYGFGNLAPSPTVIPTLPAVPATPPTTIGLSPLAPGASPLQAQNIRAPPIIIIPTIGLSQGYTDNPRSTPSTLSDSLSRFDGGTTVSFDTARLQGQLSGSIGYTKYARATDQDALNVNLVGFGLGTIVRDHVFLDMRAAVTPLANTAGIGFAQPSTLRNSQQTQSETISLTPIARESFDGYVDGELRYNIGVSTFQNGSFLSNSNSPTPVTSTSPSDTTQQDATLTLATGRRFTVFGSRLTLDASKTDSQSSAKSTGLQAFDDLSYMVNTEFSPLARIGYEDIEFPLQPSANTKGLIWSFGGQFTPGPGDYLILRYGRQNGFNGVNGTLRYQLTASTTLLASAQQNLVSSQGAILSNLNSSQLNSSGTLINTSTGLPTTLANPTLALQNNATRQQTYQIGLQTGIARDSFGVFAVLTQQSASGPVLSATGVAQTSTPANTSRGVNLTWGRALSERLTSAAAVGYTTAVVNRDQTLTASWLLTYTMSEKLNLTLNYQFIDNNSPVAQSATATGSYRRNQVELALRRSF